ncbi:7,8-didemethyl-8-hydroxy-5-deazariboflavin synthase subunit CofG, partial [Patulibacter sp. S7RM1-6]
LHTPREVEAELDEAVKRRAKELLILTGEEPDSHREVRAQLQAWGFEDFVAYVVWAGERALERGLLPHTNLGAVSRGDLARLRTVAASQGVMLESISSRLMETVHAGSPSKHPDRRMATIRAAGELRIPFTTGILVGIGETRQERLDSLAALADAHREFGHLQEVILQNFVPHQRYYGRDVGAIADASAREYWRTGIADGRPQLDLPSWATPVTVDEMV